MSAPTFHVLRPEVTALIRDHVPVSDGCACGRRTSLGGLLAGFGEAEWADHVADELAGLVDRYVADLTEPW